MSQDMNYFYFNTLVNDFHFARERARALQGAYDQLEHLRNEELKALRADKSEGWRSLSDQQKALRDQLKTDFPELKPQSRENAQGYEEFGPHALHIRDCIMVCVNGQNLNH